MHSTYNFLRVQKWTGCLQTGPLEKHDCVKHLNHCFLSSPRLFYFIFVWGSQVNITGADSNDSLIQIEVRICHRLSHFHHVQKTRCHCCMSSATAPRVWCGDWLTFSKIKVSFYHWLCTLCCPAGWENRSFSMWNPINNPLKSIEKVFTKATILEAISLFCKYCHVVTELRMSLCLLIWQSSVNSFGTKSI